MSTILVQHPETNPALISYVRPELRALRPGLAIVRDCYHLMKGVDLELGVNLLGRYLPQEAGEPDAAYTARLGRATYSPTFRDAVRAFAGMLSGFELNEPPETLEQARHNVDLLGSSIERFLTVVDELVLRDGGVVVMVEMPPEEEDEEDRPQSALEERLAERRPYLVPFERDNVINWRTQIIGGREVLQMAVLRVVEEVADDDFIFGTKLEARYIHLTPGRYRRVRLVAGLDQSWREEVLDEGETTLPVVPLVWYGATGAGFGQGDIPLALLADLSIQHMQLRSDLGELLHKLSMPVPVRIGAPRDSEGRRPTLTIGPNTAVDLDEGGDFRFAEPTGSSLQQHQDEIKHVEALMDRSSLAFLYGEQSNTPKTATEAALQSSQIASQVRVLIESKEAMFDHILRLWTAYTKEKLAEGSGIEVDDDVIQRPLESADIAAKLSLFGQGVISHLTLLTELIRGKALSQDLDPDEEIKRVAEEKKKAMQDQLDLMKKEAQITAPPNPSPEEGGAPPAEKPSPGKPAAAAPPAKAKVARVGPKKLAGDTAPSVK